VDLSHPLVISVSRRLKAPASQLFALLRDPRRHVDLDGSGMIRGSDAPLIKGVGDVFVVRMHNDMFGDYEMCSEVVEYVLDRALAWAPRRYDVIDEDPWNHRWGWRLSPFGAQTEVTAYYDCTRLSNEALRTLENGEWGRPILETSLERLKALTLR